MSATTSPRPSAPSRPRSRSAFTPRDVALLGVLALLWGHSFLFIKSAVETVPPTWIVAARIGLGGVLLLAITTIRRHRLPGRAATIGLLALIGLVGVATPWMFQAWAQQFLDSGLVAVLNASAPAATMVIAVAVGQEPLRLTRVVGLGIAIVGLVVVIGGEVGAGRSVPALLAAALATIGFGVAAVLTRARISGRVAPLPAATTQLVAAALVMLPLALVAARPIPSPGTVGGRASLAVLALGVLGTGVAYFIYFTLIQRVGATNAIMVTYLVPVVALVAGAVFRGERFGLNVLLGAVVLIAGVYLAQREPVPEVPPAG